MRPEYYCQSGSMFENPYGVPHEEILRMIRENPPEVTAQVVFGKFVEASGLVFTAEIINQLFDRSYDKVMGNVWMDKPRTLQGRLDQDAKFDPYRYAIGVDLARKKDYTVIFVIDLRADPHRVVYFKRLNRVPWPTIYAEIAYACWLYSGYELWVDGTGSGGDVVFEALCDLLYCPKHHVTFDATAPCPQAGESNCDWKNTPPIRISPQAYIKTSVTKPQLVNHLQNCLDDGYDAAHHDQEFGRLRCPPIHQLSEELTEYAWDDKKLTTDCVMALGLACQAIKGLVEDVLVGAVHG